MALPALIPANKDYVVVKNTRFTIWGAFAYDLADEYDLLFTIKRTWDDEDSLMDGTVEFYDSADPKKFRVDLYPDDTKDIDITPSAKAVYALEAHHLTDDNDKAMLMKGKITFQEKGRASA